MTASSQAVVGYYTDHCHPQLRGQTVYVQLADQTSDFKRDAMPQVFISLSTGSNRSMLKAPVP